MLGLDAEKNFENMLLETEVRDLAWRSGVVASEQGHHLSSNNQRSSSRHVLP